MKKSNSYPIICNKCKDIMSEKCNHSLKVKKPYIQQGNSKRIMIIGQDPTLYKSSTIVNTPLMLDYKEGQLRRWLNSVFNNRFDELTIYATNLVKCTFDKPPTKYKTNTTKFLEHYFNECKYYLLYEIEEYRPEIVITLGETAHLLFIKLMKNNVHPEKVSFASKMSMDFNGKFYDMEYNKIKFKYSPCLHIKTFRTAEIYGEKVYKFKANLNKLL